MVSTGILNHNKRGGLANPVIMAKLKNKRRQLRSYGCLTDSAARRYQRQCRGLFMTARSTRKDHDPGLNVMLVVNMHRWFALEPVMHKRATLTESLFADVPMGELK